MSSFPENFIAADRVNCASATSSKKRVLEAAGHLLAHADPELDEQDIFNRLLERERLGSTGFGHGVALPHARVAGIDQAYGCFLRLGDPVDFDAIDDAPVDLVFALLAPEDATDEHLRILSTLASLFGDASFRDSLRNAECSRPEQFLRILDAQHTTAGST